MPARLAESTSDVALQPSQATLGTTISSKCVQAPVLDHAHALHDALTTFSKLPSETHVEIMTHLDPLSQMCLGLTSRSLHHTFHTIHGAEAEGYNVKRRPFDLRMQASVCGKYVLNWWYDDWFLRDSKDIDWNRSLGELLFDEKLLWDDLRCCPQCLTFKPKGAYTGIAWEDEMLTKHGDDIASMAENDVEWYKDCCRRCRAKMIWVTLDMREEFLEDGGMWEERKSLGLVKLTDKSNAADSKLLGQLINGEQWHELVQNYERWQDIYIRLGI